MLTFELFSNFYVKYWNFDIDIKPLNAYSIFYFTLDNGHNIFFLIQHLTSDDYQRPSCQAEKGYDYMVKLLKLQATGNHLRNLYITFGSY